MYTNHSFRQVPCPLVNSQPKIISSEKFWRFCCCYLVGWLVGSLFCLLGYCCCCCLVFWAGFEVFLSHNTLSELFSFIFSLSYRSFAIYYGFQFMWVCGISVFPSVCLCIYVCVLGFFFDSVFSVHLFYPIQVCLFLFKFLFLFYVLVCFLMKESKNRCGLR